MSNVALELFSAEVERRKLGSVTAAGVALRRPPITLPLSAVLADLEGLSGPELTEAVDRAVDELEKLDGERPFQFRHFFTDPGLDAQLDRQRFPDEFDVAPGLRFGVRLDAKAWWERETGAVPTSPREAAELAARWMLDRMRVVEHRGLHELSGPHALAVMLALSKPLDGDPLVVVLDPGRVWLCGANDGEALQLINELAIGEVTRIARSGGVFIGEVYRKYGPGDVRRWVPPEGHALRDDFIAFRRIALRLTWELHRQLLLARQFPMPLASFEGSLDAPLTAVCSQAPCALPAVEQLVVPGLPPIPFFGLRAADLLEPLPLTGWWLLKRLPTREEALALGHVPQRWFDEQPL